MPQCLLILILICGTTTHAAELTKVSVDRQDGRYSLKSTTYFDAPQAALYRVLTDYTQFTRFSSAFVEAENREPDERGRPRFYTRMEGCVLWFCKSYIRYGYLELKPKYDIVSITDPELSNFKYARERWRLIDKGDKTVMIYEFEMEPAFWIPPVVGPYFIKRSLARGGGDAVNRIEALALGKEPMKVGN